MARSKNTSPKKAAVKTPTPIGDVPELPLLERPSAFSWALLVLLLILCVLSFRAGNDYGFVGWDDPKYVEKNEVLGPLSGHQVSTQFQTLVMGNYHPVTMLSYSADISLAGGKDPQVMHRTNLVLHVIAAVLVTVFCWLLTGRPELSTIAALLFAVHPYRVETVGWISDRKDLLMLCFGMLMLACYILFLRRKHWIWLGIGFVCFLFACLSKGMAVSLAPTLLAIDLYYGRSLRQGKIWLEKAPFLIAALVFGVVAVHAQVETATVEQGADLNAVQRLFLAVASMGIYVAQTVVPVGLCSRYDYPSWEGVPLLIHLIAATGAIALAYAIIRSKQRLLWFGGLFFLLNIALVLQLFQVGSMIRADRYTYLSGVGLSLMLAWAVGALVQRLGRWRVPILGVMGLYAASLAWFSHTRMPVWSTPMAVWDDMIEGNPKSAIPYVSRAATYYAWGRFPEAIATYDIALRLDPRMTMVRYDRGVALVENGRYADGMKDLLHVFEAKVKAPPALLQNMIYATMKLGRFQDAGANATAALRLDSTSIFLYNTRAYCALQLGQVAAAEADIKHALTLDADSPDALYLQGLTLLARTDTTAACAVLNDPRSEHIADKDMAAHRIRLLKELCPG